MARERRRRVRRTRRDRDEETNVNEVENAEEEEELEEELPTEDVDEVEEGPYEEEDADEGDDGEEEEYDEDGDDDEEVESDAPAQLFQALGVGDSLLVTRTASDLWLVAKSGAKVTAGDKQKPKRKGLSKKYSEEVLSEEYKNFKDSWDEQINGLSPEERVELAESTYEGFEWDGDMDTYAIRFNLVPAICDYLGISKYKPEYQDPFARKRAKELDRIGEL